MEEKKMTLDVNEKPPIQSITFLKFQKAFKIENSSF